MIIQLGPLPKGSGRFYSYAGSENARNNMAKSGTPYFYADGSVLKFIPDQNTSEMSPAEQEKLKQANDYDVFEWLETNKMIRRIDISSEDNLIFVTGRCNSNCIMCPSPEYSRKHDALPDVNAMMDLLSHIPDDIPHLTISGGEPFLAGQNLFRVLGYMKEKFPETDVLLLTNGRVFCLPQYMANLTIAAPERLTIGIPVHASGSELHDQITQTPGSFEQTMQGVKNLLEKNFRIELRIVVSKLNYEDLPSVAALIAEQFPKTAHVSIIGLEMTGGAHVNRSDVWISYRKSSRNIQRAVKILAGAGIDVRLYNFPLCTIDPGLWMLAKKSISPYKVRYAKICDECIMKKQCGGFFAGTRSLILEELEAVR